MSAKSNRKTDTKQKNGSVFFNPIKIIGKLLTVLVIAILGAGLLYSVFVMASLYAITDRLSSPDTTGPPYQATYKINTVPPPPPVTPAPIPPPAPAPAPKTVKPKKPEPQKSTTSQGVTLENNEIQEAQEGEQEVEPYGNESNPAEVFAQDLEDLRQSLPNNRMVPVERTEAEAQALLDEMEEQETLQQLVDDDIATFSDRERLYELRLKSFEDEIELINHCSQKVSSSGGTATKGLCADIAADKDRRLKEIENSMDRLRQDLLL